MISWAYLHLRVQGGDDRLDGGLSLLGDLRKKATAGALDPSEEAGRCRLLQEKGAIDFKWYPGKHFYNYEQSLRLG